MSMECKLCEIVSAKLRLVFFLVDLSTAESFHHSLFSFLFKSFFLPVNVVKRKVSDLVNSSFSSFKKTSFN